MSISSLGSALPQSIPHIHRRRADAGNEEPSASQPGTGALTAGTPNPGNTGSTSSVLNAFLAQLSSLDSQDGSGDVADANGTTDDAALANFEQGDARPCRVADEQPARPAAPSPASSPIDQLMQTLQAFAAKTS